MPRLSCRTVANERACLTAKATSSRTEYRVVGLRGLVLQVNDHGTKNWAYLFKSPITGLWRKVSLGSHPTISLQGAKERALDCLADVRRGKDPLGPVATSDLTFRMISQDYIDAHLERHTPDWSRAVRQTLDRDILPAIGNHRAEVVRPNDVARIMERIVKRGAPASANEALKVARVIFRWAISTGRAELDPTVGLRKLPRKPRHRVLADHEIKLTWNARTELQRPYRLQLLTATRIGEVVNAEKAEFDLENRTWTIPPARTKSRRLHQLPLSPLAVDVVVAAMEQAGRSRWLFPGALVGQSLHTRSAATILARVNRAAGIVTDRFTPHDLRRTAATRIADLGFPDEVVERILNHAGPTTSRRHYNLATRTAEMKVALDAWAAEVERIVAGPRP